MLLLREEPRIAGGDQLIVTRVSEARCIASLSEGEHSGMYVSERERYSSPMRIGSDPRITIPASGSAVPQPKALQKASLGHSHTRIKIFLHRGWQL
ncbi:hypothetical protein IP68_13705 [Blastomonas sp. AAP25]|nr:hypothetical protein IP68_13705 [Blastomonas sp. AAP25]